MKYVLCFIYQLIKYILLYSQEIHLIKTLIILYFSEIFEIRNNLVDACCSLINKTYQT